MKSFRMCRLSALVGLGVAALFLTPACKAQEVSPDHFTDTGVQDVYESTPVKTAAAKPKQTVQTQAQSRNNNSSAVVQAAERTPLVPPQGGSKTDSSKRKSPQAGLKKP